MLRLYVIVIKILRGFLVKEKDEIWQQQNILLCIF